MRIAAVFVAFAFLSAGVSAAALPSIAPQAADLTVKIQQKKKKVEKKKKEEPFKPKEKGAY